MTTPPTRMRVRKLPGKLARLMGMRFHNCTYAETNVCRPSPVRSLPPDIRVTAMAIEPLDIACRQVAPQGRAYFRRAVQHGSRCYGVWVQTTRVGVIWVNRSQVTFNGVGLTPLPVDGAFTHGGHILPAFRGRGYFSILVRGVHAELRQDGVRFVGALIARGNGPSLAVRRHLGAVFRPAPIVALAHIGTFVFTGALPVGVSLTT